MNRIPYGKHKNKPISSLTDAVVNGLYGSWMASTKLKNRPFFRVIVAEAQRRGIVGAEKNPVSKRKAKSLRRLSSKSESRGGQFMRAVDAFKTKNAAETVEFQNKLIVRGEIGQVAFGLFRAQKRSTKAKEFRGSMRRAAYDGKGEALKYLDSALALWADMLGISWGWRRDPVQAYHDQVLYVDLPNGRQCSFHSDRALSDKQFEGEWIKGKPVFESVLEFADHVMETASVRGIRDTDLMPFGKHVGKVLGDIDGAYWGWLADWEGLKSWSSIEPFVVSRTA